MRFCIVLLTTFCINGIFADAEAAFGYFLNGAGANNRATSGTGVAFAEDPLGLATNPAGIVGLPGGNQWQLGVTLLRAGLGFTASEFEPPDDGVPTGAVPIKPGTYHHDPDVPAQAAGIFPIPNGAAVWELDEDSAFAIGLYGNGGLNNTYQSFPNQTCPDSTPQEGVLCFGDLALDFAQSFIAPTYARRVTPSLRVGASLLTVWQTLEIRGLQILAEASRDPEKLSNNGHDDAFGVGAKFGFQYRVTPSVHVGASYQTETYMERFKGYSGLLAERGKFNIPPLGQIGLAWDATQRLQLLLDIQKIWYSEIPAIANSQTAPGRFGADDGPGFGWDDVVAYKAGFRFNLRPRWTVRGGYSSHDSPLPRPLLFNVIALSTFDEQVNGGVSYRVDESNSVEAGFTWSTRQTHEGPNPTFPRQTLNGNNEIVTLDLNWRRNF